MTAERHQLVVAPKLDDAAGIHDGNLVGVPDRRQAMGNHQTGGRHAGE